MTTVAGTAPHCVDGGTGWWYVKVGGNADRWTQGTDSLCATAVSSGNYALGSPAPWGAVPCMSGPSKQSCESVIQQMGCNAPVPSPPQPVNQQPSYAVESPGPFDFTVRNQAAFNVRFTLNVAGNYNSGTLLAGQKYVFSVPADYQNYLPVTVEYNTGSSWKQLGKISQFDPNLYGGQYCVAAVGELTGLFKKPGLSKCN